MAFATRSRDWLQRRLNGPGQSIEIGERGWPRVKIETMKVVSLNTGLPREVMWHGSIVTTAIFKKPVTGRVRLARLNLDGDRQADLKVHGGVDKAVYCYPIEHYDYWRKELPGRDLPAWDVRRELHD